MTAEQSWRRWLIEKGAPEPMAARLIPDGMAGGEARSLALQAVH